MLVGVALLHTYLLYNMVHIGWNHAFTDAIFSTTILGLSSWGIILLLRSYPTTVAVLLYALTISTALASLSTLAEWSAMKWWLSEDVFYTNWLNHTLLLRFIILWLLNTSLAVSTAQKKKIAILESRFQVQTDASLLLREAELFKLRQQLQPHFLYNSLNSINALIMIEPSKAQEMVGKLSDFLRNSVKREAEELILIDEELEYIESYLAIESVRFGDRLQVSFDKEYTDDALIPPFLLQPILENAIKFGLYGKTGDVKITIHIALKDDMLTIRVTNPYDPQMSPPKGTGFGLEGIQRRLYLLYARTDLLETHKDEEIFTTILKIPQANV
jgi:sensor histidine kinase YesM